MKNIIVYAGGFGLPSRTASAQRARENANLFRSLGYEVVLLGKLSEASGGYTVKKCIIDGFTCFDIRQPDEDRTYHSYETTIESIQSVISYCGETRVFAIIAYNYPPAALRLLIEFTRARGIKMIAECTEWHGIEGSKIIRNLLRFVKTEYRMRILARRAGNIICASRQGQAFYLGYHTIALPFVIDVNAAKWQLPSVPPNTTRRFIYAGSPGLGMSKDYVHRVIEAFADLKRAGYDFEFVVVGITLEQFLDHFPTFQEIISFLKDNIKFLGRLPHEQTLREIHGSDYFVFLRPQNRVSRFGFPTKLAEAFSCGIPTITNNTSDIGHYLQTGKNGFLLSRPDVNELKKFLIEALALDDEVLLGMKQFCRNENPFRMENFQEQVRNFLDTAQ